MLNLIFCILSFISTTTISVLFLNGWYLFFIPLVFLGCYVGCFFVCLILTLIYTGCINMKKEVNKPNKFHHKMFVWAAEYALFLSRVKVEIEDIEKIPTDTKFLLIANHISGYDPIIAFYILKKFNIAYISKVSNLKVPVCRKFMHANGFRAIDRENDREALKTIIKMTKLAKDGAFSIGVYPEGTRNKTEEILLPFRSGCFKIATAAKIPTVILATKGTEKIHKNWPFKKSVVKLRVLDVFEFDKFENTTQMSDYSSEIIKEFLEKKEEKNGSKKEENRS